LHRKNNVYLQSKGYELLPDMNTQTLNFTIFCISSVAEHLSMNARDVYHKLQDSGIISGYIVPCYDVLHSFSKEYIVEDLVTYMKEKGVLA
jgi:hypothetical protein